MALTAALPFAFSPIVWSKARVPLTYLWRHRRWPDIAKPALFTEWVQWRKLNDRDAGLAMLTDKLLAKGFAASRIGTAFVIPTLWHGTSLPSLPPWPLPFILKANHGCGQFVVVRCVADWQRAQREAPGWLARPYGYWLDEWHYTHARRLLLVEPFIGPDDALPIDYKIYVFDGVARCIQVHLGRASQHRWFQYDRDWHPLSTGAQQECITPPVSLAEMLKAAECIAAGRDHLRVDFYEVGGRPMFGETCLFPGSGLDRFQPALLDKTLGDYWSRSVK
ncbi:ATP-grasp fold amidoligase family protein [Sphingorhabdus sp.]|uniref:ATP-grasp fold amidoligase family protein n=1 Tax=Sphingorhabdus sp. TaxID=1902408 RepID=UPI003593D4EF